MSNPSLQLEDREREGGTYEVVDREPRGVSLDKPQGASKPVLLGEEGRTSREEPFDEHPGESLVHPPGDPKNSNWEAPTDRTGLEGNRADMNSIATSVFTTCVFTDEPQGESLVQPQGGEPRESTRGVPTDRIRLEGNPAVLNSIATSVATTVVCTDEPQGESLVKPQGGDPKEPNRGGPQGRNRLTSIRASHWSTLRAIQRNPTGHPPTAPGWRGTGRR